MYIGQYISCTKVIDFKQLDGHKAKEHTAYDFLLKAALDTQSLNNLMKVGQTHIKMK